MPTTSDNKKRIAKNTLLLYVRMLFLMLISLYTSRVILNALGVQDFGIYNAVGGVVSMFSILSGSLSSAISRFVTFELGKGNIDKLKKVFSASVTIQILLALIIVVLIESVGVWFLNYKMSIPEGRMEAANWVLQFSIVTFVINLVSVPYNATIIAHERMSAFAFISIFEGLSKLAVALLIVISPIDRLVFYSVLMCSMAFFVRLIYGFYCKNHFEECKYRFHWDKDILKQMFGFAGWSFLGNGAYLLNTQGINILMNLYFGVVVNAARGVAVQVDSVVRQFINNFTTAVNPQITKSYAQEDLSYMHHLICQSAKFSAFLMIFFLVPFMLESDIILRIWLKNVPNDASVFVKWILINSFVDTALTNSLVTAITATGRIKRYQIVVASFGLLVFPLTWIAYKLGAPAEATYAIFLFIYVILIFVRLIMIREYVQLKVSVYIRNVLFRVIPVLILSFIIPSLIAMRMSDGILRLLTICVVSMFSTSCIEYFIGFTVNERVFLKERFKFFFRKLS